MRDDEGDLLNLLIFDVEGHLPPKKDGATSMWNKRAELPRIVALRQAAAAAMGARPPFDGPTALSLVVHIACNTRGTGDLDNFVTGVCDALQCCAPRAAIAPEWEAPELAEVHPRHVVALVDDVHIVEINARKVVTPSLKAPRYRVELRRLEQE